MSLIKIKMLKVLQWKSQNIFMLLMLLISLKNMTYSHKCIHNQIAKKGLPKMLDLGTSKRKTQSSTYHSLNVYIDYDLLQFSEESKNLSQEMIENTKKTFENVKNMLSALFNSNNNMKFSFDIYEYLGKPCFEGSDDSVLDKINKEKYLSGIAADYIIFPLFRTLDSGVVASASSCMANPYDNGRPFLGYININLNQNFSTQAQIENMERVFLHEITHALGFSPGLFPAKYKKTKEINGQNRTFLASPKLLAMAKKHFGCNTMIGVELEDDGGEGTVGSHWESRVMLGDYMIGSTYDDFSISDITLAYFEDQKWYKVNYYTGGLFKFGKGEGCGFLESDCSKTEIIKKYPNEYCEASSENKCYTSLMAKGKCFSGYSSTDDCPIIYMGINSRQENNCIDEKETELFSESFGTDSRCFMSTISVEQKITTPKAICYKTGCDDEKKELLIYIDNTPVRCTKKGENKTVDGYNGYFICPGYDRICTAATTCTSLNDCISKQAVSHLANEIGDIPIDPEEPTPEEPIVPEEPTPKEPTPKEPTENPEPNTPKEKDDDDSKKTTIIVVCIVIAVVLIIAIIILIVCCKKSNKGKQPAGVENRTVQVQTGGNMEMTEPYQNNNYPKNDYYPGTAQPNEKNYEIRNEPVRNYYANEIRPNA